MSTLDFITELFCRVDDAMTDVDKHSQAVLYPSEVVTLGLLFAVKGVGNRAFYRWIKRDYLAEFPHLPERTRLFRLFATHQEWTNRFLADPTIMGLPSWEWQTLTAWSLPIRGEKDALPSR